MKKLTTKIFIDRAIAVHGNRYDYSKSIYKNKRSSIVIICKKHGEFTPKSETHLSGFNCPKCRCLTKNIINDRLKGKGIALVDDYHGNKRNSVFKCIHGHEWSTRPANVMRGTGCPWCVGQPKHTSKTIQEKLSKYGIKLLDEYTTGRNKSLLKCVCGEEWKVRLDGFFSKEHNKNCPSCSSGGFNSGKRAILYYLRIANQNIFKIGITNRTVEKRFTKKEMGIIEVIKIWEYKKGFDAMSIEKQIKDKFSNHKYKGVDLLESGNTELFSCDILGLFDKDS